MHTVQEIDAITGLLDNNKQTDSMTSAAPKSTEKVPILSKFSFAAGKKPLYLQKLN